MTETDPAVTGDTLYVCQECGDGFDDPTDTGRCPACGGPLKNTTVPHD